MADKQAFQRGFRFALAIENSADPGYCTEKIVDAWAAGAVPVYGGDPLVKQEFNPAAFVCADDYESPAALADALVELSKDRDAFLRHVRGASPAAGQPRGRLYDRCGGAGFPGRHRGARAAPAPQTAAAGAASMKNDLKYYHTLAQKRRPPQTAVAENFEDLEFRVQS